MPLPSSGAISLNQMHVEVGGSSGTQCSINDSDIRGLISKASGAQSSFSQFYGASASSNWSATLGVGLRTVFKINYYGYILGDVTFATTGSISDSTVDNFSGTNTLRGLYWTTSNILVFAVNGSHANSSWSTMTIGGTTFSRTSATYSTFPNSNTPYVQWVWPNTSTNPFGTSGTKSVSLS